MSVKKRFYCPVCGEFIGEYELGNIPPCQHCSDKKNIPIPLRLITPQGKFSIDSIDFARLNSIKFELFKVVDPRPRVGELKNMGGYTGIYEKVIGRELNFNPGISVKNEALKFVLLSLNMVSVWVLENCQEYAIPVMVKITPGYEVENEN